MKLYNVNRNYRWSDQGFSTLLEVLSDMFPEKNNALKSMYEDQKKTMRVLGLNYGKIRACKNDCILFYKEYAYLNKCPTCGEYKWKNKKRVKKRSN